MFPSFTSAGYISRLFFWWIGPLVKTGYKRDLEDEDVFDVDERSHSAQLAETFWQYKQTRSTWKALWVMFRRDILVSGFFYLISVALRFMGPLLLDLIVTFITQSQSSGSTDISLETAFALAVCLFLAQVIGSLCSVHADFLAMRLGLNARDALTAATFRHLSMLSNTSRAKTNNGMIMSLVSNDAMVALEFMRFWNQIWTSPFVLVAGITYIHILVGVSVWAGMSILVVFLPFSYFMGKAQTKYQKQKMVITDQRVKLSSEALQGIRIVKFNAWEQALEKVLSNVRKDELVKLRALEYVKALTTPVSVAVPNIASVLTFITYVATGNELDPASTFSVISLFVLIRQPFVTFPMAIAMFSRVIVMNNRFDDFFNLERSPERTIADNDPSGEASKSLSFVAPLSGDQTAKNRNQLVPSGSSAAIVGPPVIQGDQAAPTMTKETSNPPVAQGDQIVAPSGTSSMINSSSPSNPAAEAVKPLLSAGSMMFGSSMTLSPLEREEIAVFAEDKSEFSWDESSSYRLRFNQPVTIKRGEFVAIVGSVGSGKTSALLALMGEMNRISGRAGHSGRAAYCAQEPFILNATLRDNVLFGLPMQIDRYVRSIRLACLEGDVEKLPGGDLTEIGERGVNLSGGQKARVALARALYSGADVLFLDDVLSAVDAHVGKTILEDCLMKMRRKTRILVTNNLHVLSGVDRVIVLVDGQVVEFGKADELLKLGSGGALVNIMREMVREEDDDKKEQQQPKMLMAQNSEPDLYRGEALASLVTNNNDETPTITTSPAMAVVPAAADPFEEKELTETESRFREKMLDPQKSVQQLAAASATKLTSKETRVRGKVSNKVLATYWLSGALHSYWLVCLLLVSFILAEAVFLAVDSYLANATQQTDLNTTTFLIIYSCLTIGAVIGILLRSFSFAVFHLAAVNEIYESASSKMLRFPMTFYWKEPLGRLLNRLSADTNVMDTMLGSR